MRKEEIRQQNPIKEIAILLAHQMDDERKLNEGYYNAWQEEEIKFCGKHLRNEIVRKGFNIQTVIAYAEEYKTLSWDIYRDWIYR